jgi:dihydrofolate reductase
VEATYADEGYQIDRCGGIATVRAESCIKPQYPREHGNVSSFRRKGYHGRFCIAHDTPNHASESTYRKSCNDGDNSMKTQYYTAASLDGFIATADDSLEWLFQLGDIGATSYPDFIRDVGALAMGAATYEWMLRHAVGPEASAPEPWPYEQPTWVFSSRTLPPVPGADIRFVRGDVRPVHEEMAEAAGGKNIWLVGGGDLVGQFHDQGLLDELFVQIGSVTLGAGKPLLPRSITNPPLRLLSARAIGNGFAELHYEVLHTQE